MPHLAHAAARLSRSIKWHRPYYLLAAFNVLVVALGMLLNHQLVESYQRSVSVNRAWVEQLASYSALVSFANDLSVPGMTAFESREFTREEQKLRDALNAFNDELAKARQQLEAHSSQVADYGPYLEHSIRILRSELDSIDGAMQAMVREVGQVFSSLKAGDPADALTHMDAMDRRHSDVIGALAVFREHVALIQSDLLAQEMSAVDRLRRYQYVILGLVLIMVAAAIAYGRYMIRELAAQSNEREGYLAALRDSEEKIPPAGIAAG